MSSVYFAGRAKACPAARAETGRADTSTSTRQETGRAGPGPDATRLLASRCQNLKKIYSSGHDRDTRMASRHQNGSTHLPRESQQWRPLGPEKFPTQGAFGAIKLLFHRGTLRNSGKRGVTRFLALTELPGLWKPPALNETIRAI